MVGVVAIGLLAAALQVLPDWLTPYWIWIWAGLATVLLLVWVFGPRSLIDFQFVHRDEDPPNSGELTLRVGGTDLEVGYTHDPVLVQGKTSLSDGPIKRRVRDLLVIVGERPWHDLNFNPWQLAIGPNLAWKLKLESTLGNVAVNLREAYVYQISVVTDLGDVTLITPAQGAVSVHISTTLGDVQVLIPEEVFADVRIDAGAKSKVRIDPQRFPEFSMGRWRSAEFDQQPNNRLALTIETTSGDVTVL